MNRTWCPRPDGIMVKKKVVTLLTLVAAWHPLGLASNFSPVPATKGLHEPLGFLEPSGRLLGPRIGFWWVWRLELGCVVCPEVLEQLVQLVPLFGLVESQQPPQLVLPPRLFGFDGAGRTSWGGCWRGARTGGWVQAGGWSLPSQVVRWCVGRLHGLLGSLPSQVVRRRLHGLLWATALALDCFLGHGTSSWRCLGSLV